MFLRILILEYQARRSLRRACQKMAARPEANMTQVPASGTTPVPQGPPPFFFLPPSPSPPTQHPFSLVPFFLVGPQSPEGSGGGEIGVQFPPTNGSYKLSGPTAPRPGT